jgi:ribosomal protein S18 acetylase RimI-like enzyme
MQIRDAGRADQQAILNLYLATPELHTNAGVDFRDPAELEYAFSDHDKKVFLVAADGEDILGFIYVKIKHRTSAEEKARIIHLVVTKDVRGKGVAPALLNRCVERLKEMDLADDETEIPLIYCCFNADNKGMKKFLEKHGFQFRGIFYRFERKITGGTARFDYDDYDLQHDD